MEGAVTPRLATFLMFVVNGAVVGTWVAAIPGTKAGLGASGGEFGLALLFAPLGALVAQQIAGQLLVRGSSRRLLTGVALVFPWLMLPPIAAPSLPWLAATLFVFGYVNTTMDVSMNAHGIALEERGGKSIVSGLHAGWSLGGVGGAIGVAVALALDVDRVAEAVVAAALLWLLVVVVVRHLGSGSERTEGATGLHLPTRAILPLAGLIVLIAFVEGGLTDWGGVYLDLGTGATESVASLAYAAFSLGLFLGRIGGDWAKDRIGSIRLTQGGMLLAGVTIAIVLLIGNAWVALLGMVVAGMGIGNTIPQIFNAAGRIPPGGPSLTAVFTTLTLAFVAGPPLIGGVSDAVGISGAFWLFVVASLVVALVVPRVSTAETNPRFRVRVGVRS
jgi:predicted MFS family arabinose efflux permease